LGFAIEGWRRKVIRGRGRGRRRRRKGFLFRRGGRREGRSGPLGLDIAEASAEAGQGHVISLGSGGGGGGGGRGGFRNKAGPLTEQGAGSAGGGGEGGRGGGRKGRKVVLLQGSHPAAAGYLYTSRLSEGQFHEIKAIRKAGIYL
jgi:hypothetical protein